MCNCDLLDSILFDWKTGRAFEWVHKELAIW
jgi:hypothetical protein